MKAEIKDMSDFSAKKGEIGEVSVPFLLGDFTLATAESDQEVARIYADRAWEVYMDADDLNSVDTTKLDQLLLLGLLSEIRAFEIEAAEAGEFDFEDMHSFHPTGGGDIYTQYVRHNTMDVLDELQSEMDERGQSDIDSLLEKHAGTNKAEASERAYELRAAIQQQREKIGHMLRHITELNENSLAHGLYNE